MTQDKGGSSPQLRIAVTAACNLRCFFCRPEGEGAVVPDSAALSRADIAFLVSVAAETGFVHVKFTGGEPLLRSDIVEVIRDAATILPDVQLVTNGTLLDRVAARLKEAGLSVLTLSLDAATPEVYRAIRGGELPTVLNGLASARRAGLPVRINTVISRRNVDEIPGLIAIARQHGASLKLLDLVNLTAPIGDAEWLRDFVPFTKVCESLERLGAEYAGLEETPGGVGAPLLRYTFGDGFEVVLKDSLFGLYFTDRCRICAKYPCQDAVISLRVTADGRLKKCLARDDNLVDIAEPLRLRDRTTTATALGEAFRDLVSSRFVAAAWRPPAVAAAHQ